MTNRFRAFVEKELKNAEVAKDRGDSVAAFGHLERAHILSQYSTRSHTKVHVAMLKWGFWQRDLKEILGQFLRIAGAITKTALGWIPRGNTGGSNVSPFKPLPVPSDLEAILSGEPG